MKRQSVHFLCDANTSVGFGHLSRCLKLASSLRGPGAIRFGGRFSAEARTRIAQHGFSVARPSARSRAGLAVVDIMFDKEDMDYYDLPRLGRIRKQFQRVVLLSSAMTVPRHLPVDVVVGHVRPGGRLDRRPRIVAGLDYSPVSAEFRAARGRRGEARKHIGRIFVGFGASRGVRGLTTVLDALALWDFSGVVDVLLSPFHRRFESRLGRRQAPYRLRIHSNVRSVAPLLRRADVAFGTYGNITFESLCLGVPFLAVAVKDFQLAYARRLEKRGLLVCLGRDRELEAPRVVETLKSLTRSKRQELSRRGWRAIDGLGIERIRQVIESEALRARSA
jgi:spore coat polysaccharide biosynthesis predicted glycosyltransferase SpsG